MITSLNLCSWLGGSSLSLLILSLSLLIIFSLSSFWLHTRAWPFITKIITVICDDVFIFLSLYFFWGWGNLITGHNKTGHSRRMLGSPRQLENPVPTNKNPHGVWVWWLKDISRNCISFDFSFLPSRYRFFLFSAFFFRSFWTEEKKHTHTNLRFIWFFPFSTTQTELCTGRWNIFFFFWGL